jgi:hypothetical protein
VEDIVNLCTPFVVIAKEFKAGLKNPVFPSAKATTAAVAEPKFENVADAEIKELAVKLLETVAVPLT